MYVTAQTVITVQCVRHLKDKLLGDAYYRMRKLFHINS